MEPEGTRNLQRWAEQAIPSESPNWDYFTEEGRNHLETYEATILQGLNRGGLKTYEYDKTL